jgi:hypothetical protein
MKRFRFKKIKFKKGNLKDISSYVLSILISSIILALILISLPLTERISSSSTYDLVNKSSMYWAKEYILELSPEDQTDIEGKVNKTKSILQTRLRNIGVEQSNTSSYKEGENEYIKVEVQTTKEKELIDALVKSPYIVEILTRKDDVNYEDTENPLTPYLPENYNTTDFNGEDFRNVFVTKLKNSAGEYSYFALFKTWPWKTDWKKFLEEYSGQTVGVGIDGFVTPVQINPQDNTFAVSASTSEDKYAKVTDLLYNSGNIPISYSTIAENELEVDIAEIDYIKLTEGILVAIIFIYIYLLLIEKTPQKILIQSGLSSIITVSGWITYLKISSTPIDIFILALEVIAIVVIIRLITENIESRLHVTILLLIVSILGVLFGSTYVKMFTQDLIILLIFSNLSLLITSFYITNVKKSLKI